MAFLGQLAAVTTALLWSGTATFFTLAGRQVGSVVVNRSRLLLALVLLLITHWIFQGQPLPMGASGDRWVWLALSGVVGLVLGDSFLFQSYLWIGPRLGMLMMSMAPLLAALLAWLFLGEILVGLQWLGIMVTLGGIALVILERGPEQRTAQQERDYARGLLFGLGAAAGQASGLVLAKQGLGSGFPPLSGNLIRMLAAGGALWLITILTGRAPSTLRKLRQARRSWLPIVGGAVTGPFLGVWLSLVAVQTTEVGVASTLMALSPIFMLPIGRLVFSERVRVQAAAGTAVAILGVGMLFLA